MQPLPHSYQIDLASGADGYASLSAAGLPELAVASPPEYDGPGDAWSPEHLLLASVASCFVMTFRAVARLSRIPFTELDVHASGTVAKEEGVVRFTEIVLRPQITVPPEIDRERVIQAAAKAESRCLISASLVTPVLVESNVVSPIRETELVPA